ASRDDDNPSTLLILRREVQLRRLRRCSNASQKSSSALAAHGESLAAFGAPNAAAALGTPFDARCIHAPPHRAGKRAAGTPDAGCVAPPSNTTRYSRLSAFVRGHSGTRELRRDLAEALAEAGRALPARRLAR